MASVYFNENIDIVFSSASVSRYVSVLSVIGLNGKFEGEEEEDEEEEEKGILGGRSLTFLSVDCRT